MQRNSETLRTIRAKFRALVRQFDVHPVYKRFATSPTNDGGAHIEQNGPMYAFVVTERGQEYERRETDNPDDVLYWLVSDVTREAAQQYELRHRAPGRDVRRLLFAKHVEILEGIRADWASRKRAEYEAILAVHPFRDEL
jgi:hypothetical protein